MLPLIGRSLRQPRFKHFSFHPETALSLQQRRQWRGRRAPQGANTTLWASMKLVPALGSSSSRVRAGISPRTDASGNRQVNMLGAMPLALMAGFHPPSHAVSSYNHVLLRPPSGMLSLSHPEIDHPSCPSHSRSPTPATVLRMRAIADLTPPTGCSCRPCARPTLLRRP